MPAPINAESAFIIFKREDGTFFVTTDLTTEAVVQTTASHADIKVGCSEILDTIRLNSVVNAVKNSLIPAPESQKVASSIRQALKERDIL